MAELNTLLNIQKQLKSNLDRHLNNFFHENVLFHMQANGVVEDFCGK